jgi:DNA-binding response OmpR family regulator
MDRYRILIVEDESALAEVYKRALLGAGYDVWSAPTGEEALALFTPFNPHLVLLDLGLPGRLDGFDVLAELRDRPFAHVLVITARRTDLDHVHAFDLGADDYVVKPVSNAVLVRRVRAALRHVREPRAPAFDQVYEFSGVTIDLNRAALIGTTDGVAHQVSPIERKLLARLLASPGLAVPEAELLRAGWGVAAQWAEAAPEDGVETNVLRLRKKLALAQPGCEGLIFNVRGEGYGIQPPLRVHPAQDDPPPAARRD